MRRSIVLPLQKLQAIARSKPAHAGQRISRDEANGVRRSRQLRERATLEGVAHGAIAPLPIGPHRAQRLLIALARHMTALGERARPLEGRDDARDRAALRREGAAVAALRAAM